MLTIDPGAAGRDYAFPHIIFDYKPRFGEMVLGEYSMTAMVYTPEKGFYANQDRAP